MRNVKLRAWDRKNKRMIYSDDLRFDILGEDIIVNGHRDHVIMLFVDAKDSTGRDIYAGDIVSHANGITTIEWVRGTLSFNFCELDATKQLCESLRLGRVTVIGNIYEPCPNCGVIKPYGVVEVDDMQTGKCPVCGKELFPDKQGDK